MTNDSKSFGRRLLGKAAAVAGALALVAGAASAQNNFTDAGTNVQNTFTLDYQVGGTDQPTITNDPATTIPGAVVQGSETEFTVDRLVDLTVTALNTPLPVNPGTADNALRFTVTNNGNDNQGYDLDLVDLGVADFTATNLTLFYYLDDDNSGTLGDAGDTKRPYTIGNTTLDVAPDEAILVLVEGDIPTSQTDTDEASVTLVANTRNPVTSLDPNYTLTAGDETVADTGGNTDTGEAENVLADGTGTATNTADDDDNDGAHSATGIYVVQSPDLVADKAVSLLAPNVCGAATPTTAGYYVPGACVQYVITVENQGATATAENVDIADILPDELIFFSATAAGFDTAPTDNFPTSGDACDGTGTTCLVEVTGGEIDAGNTATLTIVARVE